MRPQLDADVAVGRLQKPIFLILVILLAFGPLAFGAVEYWSVATVEFIALLLAVAWIAGSLRRGAVAVETNLMVWAATGFALWAGAQCLFGLTLDAAGKAVNLLKTMAMLETTRQLSDK